MKRLQARNVKTKSVLRPTTYRRTASYGPDEGLTVRLLYTGSTDCFHYDVLSLKKKEDRAVALLPPQETDAPLPLQEANAPLLLLQETVALLPPQETDAPLPLLEANAPLPPQETNAPLPPQGTVALLPPQETPRQAPPPPPQPQPHRSCLRRIRVADAMEAIAHMGGRNR